MADQSVKRPLKNPLKQNNFREVFIRHLPSFFVPRIGARSGSIPEGTDCVRKDAG